MMRGVDIRHESDSYQLQRAFSFNDFATAGGGEKQCKINIGHFGKLIQLTFPHENIASRVWIGFNQELIRKASDP